MKPAEQLSQFIHDALRGGSSPDRIRDALLQTGWGANEVDEAIAGWSEAPGLPPVPKPRPYASAREALFCGLLLLSLIIVNFHVGVLGFDLIDRFVADGDNYIYSGGIRWSVAALVTFVPVFLLLDRKSRHDTAKAPSRGRSLVRRWVASFALFVTTMILLGDLATTIYTLLSGEHSLRFFLKALLVALLSVLIFAYYRDEMNA